MQEEKIKKTNKLIFNNFSKAACFLIGFFCLFIIAESAEAASFYLSPKTGSYQIGNNFSVSIFVSSADVAMNAVSGTLKYPADKLSVTSISKGGTIISLWVQEPTFSNGSGSVSFEGIVLNPGYTGSSGKIITINFNAKASGNAALSFSGGSILANDGQGTNILAGLGSGQYQINTSDQEPQAPISTTPSPTASAKTPNAPLISSPTHPNPENWYNISQAKFSWALPADAVAVKILYDKYPSSSPVVSYSPPINNKQLEALNDGIWYFHAQLKNKTGFGSISHFRFQIDTQPPNPFSITFSPQSDLTDPQPMVFFSTADSLSGLSYYEVKINDDKPLIVSLDAVKDGFYQLPLQLPGNKTILVKAFDKAGNFSTASADFVIEPINPPEITEYQKELLSNEILIVKGKTYPKSKVTFYLKEKSNEKSQIVESDEIGNFQVFYEEKLSDGVYKISADVTDSRGAKSSKSKELVVLVSLPKFIKAGSTAILYLSIIIPLLALIICLIFMLLFSMFKFKKLKRKLRKEVREVEQSLQEAFRVIKKDISIQIKTLEKARTRRDLTNEEEKIIIQLKKDLDLEEKLIKKEIKDVEKEIK